MQIGFLTKLDANTGDTLWSQTAQFGISYSGVAVSPAGNGYIIGAFGNKVQIGYLAGFSADSGATTWQKQFGNGNYVPTNVSAEADGNAVFVGGLPGAVLPSPTSGPDLFVAKIDPTGKGIWLQTFGVGKEWEAEDSGTSLNPYVVADDQNNIFVAGITSGAFPGFQNPSRLGEAFVAKFASQ